MRRAAAAAAAAAAADGKEMICFVFNMNDLVDIILYFSNNGMKLCQNTLSLRLVNSVFYQRTNQLIKEVDAHYMTYQILYSLPNISILHVEGPHNTELKNDDARSLDRALYPIPEGVSLVLHFRHMTSLDILGNHYAITEFFVQSVAPNLMSFGIKHNKTIDDSVVSMMTNLESLRIGSCCKVTNKSLQCLTQLKTLIIHTPDFSVNDEGLNGLSCLETLKLSSNDNITDKGLGLVKHLKHLCLAMNGTITNHGLTQLTNLQTLTLICNWDITVDGIRGLPNLQKVIFDRYTGQYYTEPIQEAFPNKIHYID